MGALPVWLCSSRSVRLALPLRSIFLALPLALSVSLCLSRSACFTLSTPLYLSRAACLDMPVSLYLYGCACLALPVWLCLSLSACLALQRSAVHSPCLLQDHSRWKATCTRRFAPSNTLSSHILSVVSQAALPPPPM